MGTCTSVSEKSDESSLSENAVTCRLYAGRLLGCKNAALCVVFIVCSNAASDALLTVMCVGAVALVNSGDEFCDCVFTI